MTIMRKLRKLSIIVLLASALTGGTSRAAEAQLWTGALGGVAGTLSGGYITLSIVVARAQFGHYLHDPKQILGWTSMPVLIGGTTGAALGMWAPDRLGTGFVYGSAGTLIGGVGGFALGASLGGGPEKRWAFGAMGAGLGMAIGSTLGVLVPNPALDPTGKSDKAVVPVYIKIRF